MYRVLRNDFVIEPTSCNTSLIIKSVNKDEIYLKISQAEAIYLSLFDGYKDDNLITEITNKLFGSHAWKLKSVDCFLLPKDRAEMIYGVHTSRYSPDLFLSKKYSNSEIIPKFHNAPRHIILYLTQNCNRKCLYCYADSNFSTVVESDAMKWSTVENVLKQAYDMAVESVLLTGGEPMLHPFTYKIINWLGNHNIRVQIITRHLLDAVEMATINKSTLDICLSIDCADENDVNFLTGSSSSYNDFLANTRLLNNIGSSFSVSCVISRINVSRVIDDIPVLFELGARIVYINHLESTTRLNTNKPIYLSVHEKLRFDKMFLDKLESYIVKGKVNSKSMQHEPIKNLNSEYCSALLDKVTIDYNGKYLLCDRLRGYDFGFGNIFSKDIMQHWHSNELNYLRYPVQTHYNSTICEKCVKFDKCFAKNSCYARSLTQHSLMYKPIGEVIDVCNKK